MSILSWDDFEDDSQKPAAPEHKSASIDPQKAVNTQMVSDAHNTSSDVATAQPATARQGGTKHSTDSLARASAALETLDGVRSVYKLMTKP